MLYVALTRVGSLDCLTLDDHKTLNVVYSEVFIWVTTTDLLLLLLVFWISAGESSKKCIEIKMYRMYCVYLIIVLID